MWAVVPIKGFDAPKQRLAGVLSPEERGALAEHMLRDVLAALVNLEGVVVISGDVQALNLARWQGARVMQERQPGGYSAAVRQAGQALGGGGGDGHDACARRRSLDHSYGGGADRWFGYGITRCLCGTVSRS